MMKYLRSIFVLIISFTSSSIFATPFYGFTFSHATVTKEPYSLSGNQLMFDYDPNRFKWRQFNVYFDAGFSHFSVTETPYYTSLNIYSAAPVIRYTFRKRGPFFPFVELSIGLSYLNHTHLDHRNLGMHFAFQDRMGLGFFIGTKKQFSLGFHAVHYSNAHLCGRNAGITIPIDIDIGYRFQ